MIVAELSANHGHDIDIAKQTIKAAKEAGADGVKLQTYTADTLTIDCDNAYFTLNTGTIWDGRTLYNLYQEAYTPWEWHKELMEYAHSLGLIFFSTPFDTTAVDFLESLNVPAYKVASFEIMDIPLIEYMALKKKPMVISTGIGTLSDIEEAVEACRRVGNEEILLMKCTSAYPAQVDEAQLKTMPNMKETFNVEVGVSDHTLGITVPVVAVALGARMIEKHFILDRNVGGPDSSFSLTPSMFREMVDAVRETEASLGCVDYSMNEKKKASRCLGRSLFVVEDIQAGERFTEKNIRSIRPGYGISPKHLPEILGQKAHCNLKRGMPLDWSDIEKMKKFT